MSKIYSSFGKVLPVEKLELLDAADNYLAQAQLRGDKIIAEGIEYCQDLEMKLLASSEANYAKEIADLHLILEQKMAQVLEDLSHNLTEVVSSVANKMGYLQFSPNHAFKLIEEELVGIVRQNFAVIYCHPDNKEFLINALSNFDDRITIATSNLVTKEKYIIESDTAITEVNVTIALSDILKILNIKSENAN